LQANGALALRMQAVNQFALNLMQLKVVSVALYY